jgi:integrase
MAKAIEYWEKHLARKAPATAKNYRNRFNTFLERSGLTAEELYSMQREAEEVEDPRETGAVAEMVIDYLRELEKEGVAAGTIGNVATAISMFFKVNKCKGFELPPEEIPKGDSYGQRMATKDMIRRAYDRTGHEFKLRNQAMLMFAKDSGLRIGDMAFLTVRDYLALEDLTGQTFEYMKDGKAVEVKGDSFKRSIRPILTQKKKINAFVHIGPEATEALDAYIEERRQMSGQRYPVYHGRAPAGTPRIMMRRAPVFDEEQALFLGRGGRPLSKDALGQQFERLFDAHDKVSAHSLRKFHWTMLESAGLPTNWIKKLEGKKIVGSVGAYSRPEEMVNSDGKNLTDRYVECYLALQVFGEPTVDQRRMAALEEALAETKKIVSELSDQVRILSAPDAHVRTIRTELSDEEVAMIVTKPTGPADMIWAGSEDVRRQLQSRGYEVVEKLEDGYWMKLKQAREKP